MKRLAVLLLFVFSILLLTPAHADTIDTKPITYMNVTFECGCKRTGAGALMGRNCLITAAHNLVCHQHNEKLKSCDFFFSWDGNTYSGKYTGSYSYRWYADFSRGYESQDDIGYVIFSQTVSERTGFYENGIISYGDDALGWEYCTIYGYNGKKRVSDRAILTFADTKQVSWTMSSGFSGCSEGGPVLWGNSFPFVTAVYTCHSGTTGYARLLTGNIIDDMVRDGADFWQD